MAEVQQAQQQAADARRAVGEVKAATARSLEAGAAQAAAVAASVAYAAQATEAAATADAPPDSPPAWVPLPPVATAADAPAVAAAAAVSPSAAERLCGASGSLCAAVSPSAAARLTHLTLLDELAEQVRAAESLEADNAELRRRLSSPPETAVADRQFLTKVWGAPRAAGGATDTAPERRHDAGARSLSQRVVSVLHAAPARRPRGGGGGGDQPWHTRLRCACGELLASGEPGTRHSADSARAPRLAAPAGLGKEAALGAGLERVRFSSCVKQVRS